MAKQILVIDDEQGILDSFKLALEEEGYLIETATKGEDGVNKAKERYPDLIFLDLKMPGIDGVETLRRLNKICPHLRIYILTAFYKEYMDELKIAAGENIAFEICRKPIDKKQIQEIVEGVFHGRVRARPKYSLKLYIAGQTPSSGRALKGVNTIFKERLQCEYDLEVIDVLPHPKLAEKDNVLATPTLLITYGTRSYMIIGDLSNTEKILAELKQTLCKWDIEPT